LFALIAALALVAGPAVAQSPGNRPNIVVIMGDDIGWLNIGAYHQGMMAGRTPHLDKLAKAGMQFSTPNLRQVSACVDRSGPCIISTLCRLSLEICRSEPQNSSHLITIRTI
jgi:hypothetical protein